MTWAKVAGAGLKQTEPSQPYPVKWHCPIDEKNKTLIEHYCLNMARKHKFRDIAIRAGGM